jgi:HEAT repeat protein
VVQGCRALLRGKQVDAELLLALGGPAAQVHIDDAERADAYWRRVWGARGLLWAWEDEATEEIGLALADDSWRVREMAVKVVARHRVGSLIHQVAMLRADEVERVRRVAERALTVLTSEGA